ncbi:hypothetical protein EPUS_05615 [Endocarpon pusillum Z07020]|uniref:Uncharacterized protein n=1 Tax=Endocarpon pusillum (strain Z07020 / HMAS-L-300199) TaxID=1263415 RepID=U1G9V7_ENDPU|nr:uncharacterized protein EPUS_05615 [Endocarpon pusillum Z07020]ERF68476.1 hypothetical protein EPUS_05615 [Endocarpon pusillum Z07020]
MGCGKSTERHATAGHEQQTTVGASSGDISSSQNLGLARVSGSTRNTGSGRGAASHDAGAQPPRGTGSDPVPSSARPSAPGAEPSVLSAEISQLSLSQGARAARGSRPLQGSESYSQGAPVAEISAPQNLEVAHGPIHPQETRPSSHELARLSSSSQGEGSPHRSSPSTTPRTPQPPRASSALMHSQLARRSQSSSTASLESRAGRPPRSSSSHALEAKAGPQTRASSSNSLHTQAGPQTRASSSNSLHTQAARQPLMSSSASLKSLEESSWHLKNSSSPSLEELFDALERPSTSSTSRQAQQSSPRGTPRARQRPSSSRSSPKAGQPSETSSQAPRRTRPRFEPTPSQGELARYFSADPVVTLPAEALTFDEFGGSDHSST